MERFTHCQTRMQVEMYLDRPGPHLALLKHPVRPLWMQ